MLAVKLTMLKGWLTWVEHFQEIDTYLVKENGI